jgi:hypothetical protein
LKHLILVIIFIFSGFCISKNIFALEYKDQQFNLKTKVYHQSLMFSFLAGGYYVTQSEKIREAGSVKGFKDRFLEFRFDKDNSTWNLIGHPLTGSQVYLYYRALGYDSSSSLLMSFSSSLAFEVLIETYTERPSIQDTFQTPLIGAALGKGIEILSLKLINSTSGWKHFIGRVINPFSYLADYKIIPSFAFGTNKNKKILIALSYPYEF